MRLTVPGLLAWLAFTTGAARADDLIAIRPGVMCASADALARLTLPDGASRTDLVTPGPNDLAIGRAGGCRPIDPGTIVTVVVAHHNSSVVTERGGTARTIIPNIDFQPMPDGAAPAGDGDVTVQHLPTGGADGEALELLEDGRITPALRSAMWGVSDDPTFVLDQNSPLLPGFRTIPARPARLRLVSGSGAVLAETGLEHALAMLAPAPLRGLPAPAYLLTVDESIGMGSYAGPATSLLVPAEHRLDPVQAIAADGTRRPIILPDTLKTAWRIVPSRGGGTQEIELTACRPVGARPDFMTTDESYRFTGGVWRVASRSRPGFWENDDGFPARSRFPVTLDHAARLFRQPPSPRRPPRSSPPRRLSDGSRSSRAGFGSWRGHSSAR